MSRSARGTRWSSRDGARVAAAIVATAALAVTAAGCGNTVHAAQTSSTTTSSGSNANASTSNTGSSNTGSSNTGASNTEASQVGGAVAFSRCMRSHGVPTYPDPSSSGAIPKVGLEQLGVSSLRFQAAQSACGHLLPNRGRGPTGAQQQQARAQALDFARCVRAHGVPNFPDPDSTGRIPDPATVGINQGSPKFETANAACGRFRPPYMPSNAAYNVWARTHGS